MHIVCHPAPQGGPGGFLRRSNNTFMGLYLKKRLENEAEIGVWKITETEAELKELSSTPSDEMEEISFIRSESLRKHTCSYRVFFSYNVR